VVADTSTTLTSTSTVENITSATTTGTSTLSVDTKKPLFTEMLIKGGNQKCVVTQVMGSITSSGTVYIHGALVRAEFSTAVMDKTIKSTLIARDGYMYSWTDTASTTGMKTKMPTSNATSTTGVRTWNGDQVKDYTCAQWTPDEKLFEVPSSIIFKNQ
jgi:hypothetical protein